MSKPEVYITMTGGAGDEVTGSGSYLRIETESNKVHWGLVDKGIVQGENEEMNYSCPVKAELLDFVIVTHCHADHFLGLPTLRGFKGKIFGTSSTFAQGKELLDDAVRAYERQAAEALGIPQDVYKEMCYELESLKRRDHHKDLERYNTLLAEIEAIQKEALYTSSDVDYICKHFYPVLPYQDFMIAPGIFGRLIPSTHQNGSVSVEIYIGNYDEESINISFSGDIGPSDSLLYKEHNYNPNYLINYCIMESIHGISERKQTVKEAYEEIKKIVLECVKKKKTLILASFALERSAMLLYTLNKIIEETGISIPIYFDSPLAHKELMHYQSDYGNSKSYWFKKLGKNPFDTREITITDKYKDHQKVVQDTEAKIIITASAFGEGGRILDYFAHYIQSEEAMFVFVSWLNPDCTSNVLHQANRGDLIEIHGNRYIKICETRQISGYTGHGYLPEYTKYIDRFPFLKGIILNHGEKEHKEPLAEKLRESYCVDVYAPELYDEGQHSFLKLTSDSIEEISPIEGYKMFSDVLNF